VTPVVVRPQAAADIEDAHRWYEVQRVGLGGEFVAALQETVGRVLDRPDAFPIVHRGVRRALIRPRFPYGLFFRVYDDTIVIVACMHARRSPQRWKTRALR